MTTLVRLWGSFCLCKGVWRLAITRERKEDLVAIYRDILTNTDGFLIRSTAV